VWGPCADPSLRFLGGQCGFVSVPLDYNHPNGTKIRLAVSRIRHQRNARYQGVMLTNPGGPGVSGLTLSVLGQLVPNGAGDSYDWIGFDPRGVGSSQPALRCLPNYFTYNRPNYVPTNQNLEGIWLQRAKTYAAACQRNAAALLPHMKTVDSVKDMESIRRALAAPQINYYGFSYGTYLGQVYSTLFPTRVRRMVLDSNVDPRKVWYQANLDQDVAFDRNINIWFGWLARFDNMYHLGRTQKAVHDLWYSQRQQLGNRPAGGIIGPDEWTDIFLGAGYFQQTWTDLANAFAGWVHRGDWQRLKAEDDSANSVGDDNGYAVYNAVQCTDVQWPTNFAKWRTDNWRIYRNAPFETWGNAWFNAPCLFWPAKPGTPVTVNGRNVAPALLIDETLDAATPFPGSLEVRRRFPRAVLLAEPGGTSHASTPNGNPCVDNTIANYLANGALPARKSGSDRADAICQPNPQPVPPGAAASAAPQNPAQQQAAPQQRVSSQQQPSAPHRIPARPQVGRKP
jgi:pimeloyl-ACP methyl ester carboxylesterase